jgi:hypothetical protein
MTNDWIIDVLSDLRSFARQKGLNATADELEEVCLVALAELQDCAGRPEEVIAQHHEAKAGGAGQVA